MSSLECWLKKIQYGMQAIDRQQKSEDDFIK